MAQNVSRQGEGDPTLFQSIPASEVELQDGDLA